MSIIEKCNRCGRRLDWNSLYFAYDECGCVAIPSPKDQPKAPLVTPLPQVLTVANITPLPQVPTAVNMTLRDYFAGQASEHDLVYYVRLNPAISPAEARWMFADDMLKAREEKP